MTKAEQIKTYMEKLHISEEEALSLYEDDKEDIIGDEGEEYEQKAKKILVRNEKKERKPRKPKERKVDNEKLRILEEIQDLLDEMGAVAAVRTTETELSFTFGENDYSIRLIKHRKRKEN